MSYVFNFVCEYCQEQNEIAITKKEFTNRQIKQDKKCNKCGQINSKLIDDPLFPSI